MLDNKKFSSYDETKQPLYCLIGTVVRGRGIGKLVGMPTANMQTEFIEKIPPIGVYTTVIFWNCAKYYGVTNVGKRPTVDNDDYISIETYLLDFNVDIYGQEIEIKLYELLRFPSKFESLSQLREQVFIDCQITRRYFGILIQEKIVNNEIYTSEQVYIRDLHIDVQKREIMLGNRNIYLTTKEFDILYLLAMHPGWVYSKELMYERIWNENANGYYHSVENAIWQLRKKLEPDTKKSSYIKTIVGYGYKFIEDIQNSQSVSDSIFQTRSSIINLK